MSETDAILALRDSIDGVHHVLKWISAALWLMLIFKDMGYKRGGDK